MSKACRVETGTREAVVQEDATAMCGGLLLPLNLLLLKLLPLNLLLRKLLPLNLLLLLLLHVLPSRS